MIALYGGTFDCPHNGHVRVVSKILDMNKYDRVLIHVSYKPKYKKPKASFIDRVAMADLAFGKMAKNVNVLSDRFEYTSNIVRLIRKGYSKGIDFFTGFDWDISKFHDAEYIMKNVKQVKVNDRPDTLISLSDRVESLKNNTSTTILYPISIHSSDIRELLKEGRRIDGLVPEKVNKYIQERGLYGFKQK